MTSPLSDHSVIELDLNFSTKRLLTQVKLDINPHPTSVFQSLFFLPEDKLNKNHGGLRTQGYFKQCFTKPYPD